jgi:hypothetical protein
MQEYQSLVKDFDKDPDSPSLEMTKFIPIFKSLLTSCQEKPWEYKCTFIMEGETDLYAKLKIQLENEFKTCDILTIPLRQLEEEHISQEVSYRINSQKQKTTLVLQRMRDIISILEKHNPKILERL